VPQHTFGTIIHIRPIQGGFVYYFKQAVVPVMKIMQTPLLYIMHSLTKIHNILGVSKQVSQGTG